MWQELTDLRQSGKLHETIVKSSSLCNNLVYAWGMLSCLHGVGHGVMHFHNISDFPHIAPSLQDVTNAIIHGKVYKGLSGRFFNANWIASCENTKRGTDSLIADATEFRVSACWSGKMQFSIQSLKAL